MFDGVSGEIEWPLDKDGYEIIPLEPDSAVEKQGLAAQFNRPDKQGEMLLKRGVIRRKGGAIRNYRPMEENPGLARRLAGIYSDKATYTDPTDQDILEFASKYGLLNGDGEELVRDWVYAAKYIHLFAEAIDRGNKASAREIFNDRVTPHMTVRLVGSKAGKLTANWTMAVTPTNLLGALWMQIAAELTHGAKMQKCDAADCREWFPARPNKRFCNNRCKTANHRLEKVGRASVG